MTTTTGAGANNNDDDANADFDFGTTPLFLGFDSSTQSCKAAAIRADTLEVVYSNSINFTTDLPRPALGPTLIQGEDAVAAEAALGSASENGEWSASQ